MASVPSLLSRRWSLVSAKHWASSLLRTRPFHRCQDRDTAARIVEQIALKDVVTRGSFVLEGYSADRRIARARAEERCRGFETRMPMRELVPAPGAPAVKAKWPGYHYSTGCGFRATGSIPTAYH